MHYLIKELVPPIVKTLRWYSFKYGWKGNYNTFEEAQAKCTGYNENHILQKIIDTTAKVKSGEAVYERDGIIYDSININFHLLNALLLISARNNNKLTIIDFGGSLGTSYYQNISFLSHLTELNWCIIEQPNYVEAGKKSFENGHVRFFYTVEECLAEYPQPDFLLLSSVLQYINNPYELLRKLTGLKIPYFMIDLVGYNDEDKDRITVQYVPPVFYGIPASYPCTFFSKHKVESVIKQHYKKDFDFISEPDTYYIQLKPFNYEGSFWTLNT